MELWIETVFMMVSLLPVLASSLVFSAGVGVSVGVFSPPLWLLYEPTCSMDDFDDLYASVC